ncbi:MAG TPA: carboxypeptidase-like regulatory domain-containing protein, partial [Kofleriaceae bacterium]
MGRWTFLAALVVVALPRMALSQNATTGVIRGRAADLFGVPIPNATINLRGERGSSTITANADGSFIVEGLLPGEYTVELELARPHPHIPPRIFALHVRVNAGASTQVVFSHDDAVASPFDLTSSQLQYTAGARTLDLPLAPRYTEGFTSFVPTSRSDIAGVAFGDTTSYDNRWIVDGFDTTYVGTGLGGTSVPLEFLDQTTTTYGGAQLGRSLGAEVASVLHSGTNEARGSVFARYFGAPIRGAAREVDIGGDALLASNALAGSYQVGATYSGPIVRDHAWFFVGIAPQLTTTSYSLTLRSQQDCLKDNAGGVCEPMFADGRPDVDHQGRTLWHHVADESATGTQLYTPIVARFDESVDRQQGRLSVIAITAHTSTPVIDSAASTAQRETALALDLVGHWKALLGESAALELTAGWHREHVADDAETDAGKTQTQRSVIVGNFDQYAQHHLQSDRAFVQCTDRGTADLYPFITNCPLTREISEGGVGPRTDVLDERHFAEISLSKRLVAAGIHELRATASLSQEHNAISYVYSGGELIDGNDAGLPSDSLRLVHFAPRGVSTSGYDTDCLVEGGEHRPCRIIGGELGEDDSVREARARVLGAELSERWAPVPQVAVTGALRFDNEHVGALELHGYWAPRLGVVVTPTDDGRTKLFAQFTRSTELLPTYAVAAGTPISVLRSTMNVDIADLINAYAFDPALQAGSRDEWIGGAAYQLATGTLLQASYMHRRVRRAIDDIFVPSTGHTPMTEDPTDPDFTGTLVANPGEGLAADRERARRTYDALTLTIDERVDDSFFIEGAYTRSRTRGNYPG